MDHSSNPPTIHLTVGEVTEVLARGDGFPGHWGYVLTIVSLSPEIASVSCIEKRSFIPFREPGVLFGGEVCYLTAKKPGETWIRETNLFSVGQNVEGVVPQYINGDVKVLVSAD